MLRWMRWIYVSLLAGLGACSSDAMQEARGPVPPLRAVADPAGSGYYRWTIG